MTDAINDMAFRTATEAGAYIELNMFGLWALAGKGPDVVLSDDGHICAVRGTESAWPNILFNPRFEGVDVDRYLSGLVQKIRKGELPKTWVRGHNDGAPGLYDKLEKIGFKEAGRRNTMVMNLEEPLPSAEALPHFEVTQPADRAELDDWLTIASAAFFGGSPVSRRLFRETIIPSPKVRLYIAWMNGRAIGTTLLFMHAGVAGIHLVSVPETMRRRGIATRLTLHALRDAKSHGYKAAILKASPLGEGVYRRLGFEPVSRLIIYNFTAVP